MLCKDIRCIRYTQAFCCLFFKLFFLLIYVYSVYLRNMKEEIITFRASLELRQAIKAEAEKQDRTVSYIIEQLVREAAIRKKILKKT